MKLDYELKCDIENKTVSLKVNEQDERFWCKKDNSEERWTTSKGIDIISCMFVELNEKISIFLLGNRNEDKDNFDKISFDTEKETLEYYLKVKEALEEFKSYEPELSDKNSNNVTTLYSHELIVSRFIKYLSKEFIEQILKGE